MSQIAYAVIQSGQILVNTVYDSERGAKVNWLCTVPGIMVAASWSDGTINAVFDECRLSRYVGKVEVVPVTISRGE